MKIGCLLSVREKATRFPKKVLLDILDQPLTTCLLKRLSLAKEIDQIVLATSTHPADDILETLAIENGYSVFRGSELDKLDRYYRAAIQFGFDAVIIVDGDDLLCFPEGIDHIAKIFRNDPYDCISLADLPLGAAATGLRTEALAKVLDLKDEVDTEVWGGYFMGSGFFKTHVTTLADPIFNHPEIRLTLDYPEDYTLLTTIFNHMGCLDFTSHALMDLLVNQEPTLTLINESAQQKYLNHLSKAAKVRFRSEVTS